MIGIDSRRRRWLLRAGLLLLLGAAAYVIIRNGESWLAEVRGFSWELSWIHLTVSTLLLAASYWFIPAGWIILSHRAGSTRGSGELRSAWFMSQLGRYLPGKIWLFAGRAAFLKAGGLSGFRATSVPFLELLYTAGGAGVAALLPFILFRNSIMASETLKWAVTASGAALLLIPFLKPLQRSLYRLRHGSAPRDLPLPSSGDSLMLILIYAGLWWLRGAVLLVWFRGFGITGISIWTCMAAAPLSWLAGYIVFLVPGGIGVREAAVVALVSSGGLTGPLLAVVAGQRLILSVIEVFFALTAAGRRRILSERKTT